MNRFTEIFDEIKNQAEDLSFIKKKKTKNYKEFLTWIWETIRKNDQEQIAAVKENLGENVFKKLEELIKEGHKDYYAFEYFRKDDIDLEIRKSLFNKIYNRLIIVNDFSSIKKSTDVLNEKDLDEINYTLHDITNFCISYHRAATYLVEVLTDYYDINKYICEDLEHLFSSNRMSLQLDYLIDKIDRIENKIKD